VEEKPLTEDRGQTLRTANHHLSADTILQITFKISNLRSRCFYCTCFRIYTP